MNNLFANEETTQRQAGANQLGVTHQLTVIANRIARDILATINESPEAYADQVLASQTNNDALDNLIATFYDINDDESLVDFLQDHNAELLERVLKSQQSKRSRAKSHTMTVDNYLTLLTAAIAETMVRKALGKPRGASGHGAGSGDPTYSDAELNMLAEDPDKLAKAIRNVQSKKSIARSKADFDENSDRWQALLTAESQLKELRATISGTVNKKAQEAIEATEKAAELLEGIDPKNLKADDAKQLLADLQEALAARGE